MALNVTQSNESGFTDVYEYSEIITPYTIKAVYEGGGEFSVDITFSGVSPAVATVELVSFQSTLEGTTLSQVAPNTFRLSGNALNVFTDAYYQFIMPDKTLKILKADTTEEYLSLIKWEPPSIKILNAVHSITYLVTSTDISELGGITTSVFNQDVFWQWRYALQQFNLVLSKGTI